MYTAKMNRDEYIDFLNNTQAKKAFHNVLGKIITSGFDMSVDWEKVFDNELKSVE